MKMFNVLRAVVVSTVVLLATFVSVSNVASAATSWDVTGDYVVAFTLGSDYPYDVTFAQDSLGNITGNGGYPAAGSHTYTWVITSGSVSGNTVSFSANFTALPDAVTPQTTLVATGTIAPNGTMSGTWTDNYQGGSRNGTWATTSGAARTNTVVVVTGNTSAGENLPGWMFNRDLSTTTPYQFSTAQSSIGVGSLNILPIGSNASDKFIAENFINAPIADVTSIAYDFRIGSGGVSTEEEQFYMNVYANFGVSDDLKFYDCRYNVIPTVGSTGGFTTVTFDLTQAYPVTTRGGASASPYACPAIPADMNNLSAGSNIRAFAINVGDTSTSDVGLDGYLDKVVVGKVNGITTYDFEPTGSLTVTKNAVGGNGTFAFTGTAGTFTITTVAGVGSYTINNLVPGVYSVTETSQTGWAQTGNSCASVTVLAGQTATCTVSNVAATSSISGVVYYDFNRNGKKDNNEQGQVGWTVKLKVNDDAIATTVTDAQGKYSFMNLAPNTYTVKEVDQDGWKQTSKNPDPIVITTSNTEVTKINFGNAQKLPLGI